MSNDAHNVGLFAIIVNRIAHGFSINREAFHPLLHNVHSTVLTLHRAPRVTGGLIHFESTTR
jgi:hypothetical protein